MLVGAISLISVLAAVLVCLGSGAFLTMAWLWMLPLTALGTFLGLALVAFLFLWFMCSLVDMSAVQEHDSPFYRKMANLYVSALRTVLRIRVQTRGMEQMPKDGRFMLVCNHVHDSDPVLLLNIFADYQLAFITKWENESKFIVGPVMRKLMCQPINRENDREALKTILKCIQLLKNDEVSIAVFPEGYIHDDRKLHRFRHGVFKIAQKAQVPIVVCTLHNTKDVFYNAAHLKPSNIKMNLLKVFYPEDFKGMTTVELGTRIYEMMAADLGPENVYQEETENT